MRGKAGIEHKPTVCIGRTHGIHAEPTTFGLKCAVWYQDLLRARERLEFAIEDITVGKLSGAVGNFAHLPPSVEEYVMKKTRIEARVCCDAGCSTGSPCDARVRSWADCGRC